LGESGKERSSKKRKINHAVELSFFMENREHLGSIKGQVDFAGQIKLVWSSSCKAINNAILYYAHNTDVSRQSYQSVFY
jgi:hypothetical protein